MFPWGLGLLWRLIMFTRSTRAAAFSGRTRSTFPLPLSLPAMTSTTSLLPDARILVSSSSAASPGVTALPGRATRSSCSSARAAPAPPARTPACPPAPVRVDHTAGCRRTGCTTRRADAAPAGPHDHRPHHLTLADRLGSVGGRLLDLADDGVAEAARSGRWSRRPAGCSSLLGPRVVGHLQHGAHLDHVVLRLPPRARTASGGGAARGSRATRQRFWREGAATPRSGPVAHPGAQSSWATNFDVRRMVFR